MMSLRANARARVSALVMLIAVAGLAQPPRKSNYSTTVNPAPTASEQLKQSSRLWKRIYQARNEEERFHAFADTVSNIAVVRKLWPDDTGAVLQSAMMQADLALEFNDHWMSIGVLEPQTYLAEHTPLYPGCERRLGQAYALKGEFASAEKHFNEAEKALHKGNLNSVEAQSVLNAAASFYAGQKKHREAMKRFKAIADFPNQTDVNKAICKLAALKQALLIADDPNHDSAKQELRDLEDHISRARGHSENVSDAGVIESVALDAAKLKIRHKL